MLCPIEQNENFQIDINLRIIISFLIDFIKDVNYFITTSISIDSINNIFLESINFDYILNLPLPNKDERITIFKNFYPEFNQEFLTHFSNETENFNLFDLKLLFKKLKNYFFIHGFFSI
jgi:SpoVK/Ycf46/Vps4 family AAA+-type ATPase